MKKIGILLALLVSIPAFAVLVTTNVQGQWTNPDGSPVVGASIIAKLNGPDVDGIEVVPQVVSSTTDSTGSSTLALWPNSRGVNGTEYIVTVYTTPIWTGVILVPQSSSPVSLASILQPNPAVPSNSASSIYGLVSAGSNVTLTGAGTYSSPYVIAMNGGAGSGTVTSVAMPSDFACTGAGTATITCAYTGTLPTSQLPAFTGDVTSPSGSGVNTLATVNSNVGTFQGITVNGKGLVTGASNQSYLTGNQTITLSGDMSGSGTTAITGTLATVNSGSGSVGS